jgi:hypothetical protein
MGQEVGKKSGSRAEEEGLEQSVGAGDGPRIRSTGWEQAMETLDARQEWKLTAGAAYGNRGWYRVRFGIWGRGSRDLE